jgi:protein gp37
MSDNTKIEWTDATWNPVTGCEIKSAGCIHCYAMRLAGTRMKHHPSRAGLTTMTKTGPVWNGEVRFNEQWLTQPLQWSKPRMIFVCAHADLFYEKVPDAWLDQIFAIMALAPRHTFQVLTKRPERAREYLSDPTAVRRIYELVCDMALEGRAGNVILIGQPGHEDIAPPGPRIFLDRWPLPNVWLGVSAEDQQTADERIPILLDTPAAVRWLSAEPLIGEISIPDIIHGADGSIWMDALRPARPGRSSPGLHWVVAGGESGPKARPAHPDWFRSLRDQCAAARVAFLFKQWGNWASVSCSEGGDGEHFKFPDGATVRHFHSKKAAGRMLDGVAHDGYPKAVA